MIQNFAKYLIKTTPKWIQYYVFRKDYIIIYFFNLLASRYMFIFISFNLCWAIYKFYLYVLTTISLMMKNSDINPYVLYTVFGLWIIFFIFIFLYLYRDTKHFLNLYYYYFVSFDIILFFLFLLNYTLASFLVENMFLVLRLCFLQLLSFHVVLIGYQYLGVSIDQLSGLMVKIKNISPFFKVLFLFLTPIIILMPIVNPIELVNSFENENKKLFSNTLYMIDNSHENQDHLEIDQEHDDSSLLLFDCFSKAYEIILSLNQKMLNHIDLQRSGYKTKLIELHDTMVLSAKKLHNFFTKWCVYLHDNQKTYMIDSIGENPLKYFVSCFENIWDTDNLPELEDLNNDDLQLPESTTCHNTNIDYVKATILDITNHQNIQPHQIILSVRELFPINKICDQVQLIKRDIYQTKIYAEKVLPANSRLFGFHNDFNISRAQELGGISSSNQVNQLVQSFLAYLKDFSEQNHQPFKDDVKNQDLLDHPLIRQNLQFSPYGSKFVSIYYDLVRTSQNLNDKHKSVVAGLLHTMNCYALDLHSGENQFISSFDWKNSLQRNSLCDTMYEELRNQIRNKIGPEPTSIDTQNEVVEKVSVSVVQKDSGSVSVSVNVVDKDYVSVSVADKNSGSVSVSVDVEKIYESNAQKKKTQKTKGIRSQLTSRTIYEN